MTVSNRVSLILSNEGLLQLIVEHHCNQSSIFSRLNGVRNNSVTLPAKLGYTS
jgi:hypothetical protein